MVSITCPCADCEYNGRGYKCKAKSINLKYRNVATVNEGRVDMWICDHYTLSESVKRVMEFLQKSPKPKRKNG